MGADAGKELVKWEKMGGVGGHEEKILVLVRLRPLNEKEIDVNEVADWECINETTILYRNTLREGSTFPSAYTFDRVFRGDCSTKQVYEEGAKEIALSVVGGINSSIFAYGQTSSGKTYTMIGITEYAVADIFYYINKHDERAFVLKFSAIEIYNEIIRDLLSTENTPLRLRDDPERGPVVEKLTEETLRDWVHLKELLSFCEAQRQVGETYLNDKSSRSHQIIKLTIESTAREFIGKSNSTTLAASVNFVDLAGSERASPALSAGSRLKEGCHINRSLLTLGTVIHKLRPQTSALGSRKTETPEDLGTIDRLIDNAEATYYNKSLHPDLYIGLIGINLVRGLEAKGIPTQQAKAIAPAMTQVLNDSLETVSQTLVSKLEMEKEKRVSELMSDIEKISITLRN